MKVDAWTKPDAPTILLFASLVAILYLANVQSWGFCKDCGTPEPLLYNIISPVGFWLIGAIVTFPVGIAFGNVAGISFMIIQIAYVYVLSAILIQIRKKYLLQKTDKILLAAIVLLFLFTLWDIGLVQPRTNDTVVLSSEPPGIIFYFGQLLLPMAVFILVYGTLLAGMYFYLREKWFPHQRKHA